MMVTTGTDRRWQMTMPTTARHSQVVTSRGTEHLLQESTRSQVCGNASMLCDGTPISARHGACQEGSDDTSLGSRLRTAGSAGSRVVTWRPTRMLTGRRQGHSTIGVCRSHHERRSLPQGTDQDTASGVAVLRGERAPPKVFGSRAWQWT